MVLHNIKKICNEKRVALSNVERLAGLSPNSVYRWDETMPAADKLFRVAKVLGTTVEDLLTED